MITIQVIAPEDVWLGTSYFLWEDEGKKNYKIDFEILPLLTEYYKNGVFRKRCKLNHVAERVWPLRFAGAKPFRYALI